MSPELLIAAQAVFTALVAAVAYYLARQRGKTIDEGREEAMLASLQLANRTLPHLRRGLNAETGQRFPAPAGWRSGGMRAVFNLERDFQQFLHPRETSVHIH